MTQQRNQMRKQLRAVTTLAVITSILSAVSSSAWAESESKPESGSQYLSWLDGFDSRLGFWSSALGLSYMSGTQSMSSASGGSSTSTNSLMRETLKIANSGFYVLSPRLCRGNMELDLELDQDKSSGSGSSASTKDKVIGYAIDAEFLSEKPYTASVYANRNQSQVLQPLGGRIVGTNENRGALFHLRQDSILNDWGYPWVEASLGVHGSHNRSTTTSFGNSQSTDETNRTVDFNASKGFETADLAFYYQFNDMSNKIFKEGNFQSKSAGLNYSIDFGPTLNRRFDAAMNYLTRNGTAGSTTVTNSEHVHVDHYQNLNTDYQYGFSHQMSGGISTTEQNGSFSVSHQLYKNLNTMAGVNVSRNEMPEGSTTSFGGNLGEAYHHGLPGKGNLSVNWSGSYQETSNSLSVSSISVIQEAHNAPNPIQAGVGFLLKHNFAVTNSVVVINVRNGGVILTSTGVDYSVINQNNQITIVPLPGSLLINPGDPLLVNYTYQVDANLKYASQSSGYGMGVDYHWIAVAYSHQQSTQKPLSGGNNLFLQSAQQDSVQVNLQGTVFDMAANASMGFDDFKSNTSAYEQSKLTSSLIWEIQSNMRMIFGVNASESKYTVPDQHTNSAHSARSSLNWFTADGWNNTASIDWSTHKDSGTPADTLVQAIAQSSITLGQLSFSANVALGEWQRNGSRSTNRSFSVSVVRQF
jgi:hypothetical protein